MTCDGDWRSDVDLRRRQIRHTPVGRPWQQPSGQRQRRVEDEGRVLELVAVDLPQLPDAVAHGLRVDEERRRRSPRDGRGGAARTRSVSVSFSAVEGRRSAIGASTRARRSARASPGRRPAAARRGGPRSRRGPSSPSARHADRAACERRHLEPRRRRPDDGVGAAQDSQQPYDGRRRRRARHEQQPRAPRGGPARPRSAAGCRASSAVEAPAQTCDSGRSTAVSAPGGSQSARSAAADHRVGRCAGQQRARETLEVALPDPAGALELVGVAGDADAAESSSM